MNADDQTPVQPSHEDLRADLQELKELLEKLFSLLSETPQPEQEQYLKGVTVPAPLPGIFYRAYKPDEPPFVEIGDHVENKSTICVIMIAKTVNDIPSTVSGTVSAIFVEDEEEIKEGQLLMLIKPDDENHPIVSIEVDDKGIPKILARKEDPEKIEEFIRSPHVGTIKKSAESESVWLIKIDDIIQPQQEIVTVEVLKHLLSIIYKGEKPVKIVELLVEENDIVHYGTPVARFKLIEENDNDQK